jgi:hypothetical protein
MKNVVERFKKYTKRLLIPFHQDQAGLRTLDVVMILAIVAMVAIVIYVFALRVIEWARIFIEGNM